MYQAFLWNFLSKDWREVPKEEAAQNRYYGLRGWLLLFYAISVYGVVKNLLDMVSPPQEAFAIVYGDRPNLIRAMLLLSAVAQIPFLVLAPLKHRLMPRMWLAGLWIPAIVFVVAIDMPGQTDGMILRVAWTFGFVALMSWYVLHSKRVNVTYLHRVPADAETSDLVGPGSNAVPKKNFPVPAFYQRATRANRIFWGLAALAAILVGFAAALPLILE